MKPPWICISADADNFVAVEGSASPLSSTSIAGWQLAIAATTSSGEYGVARTGRSSPSKNAISASSPRYRWVFPLNTLPLGAIQFHGIGAKAGVASAVGAPIFHP